MCAHKHTQVYTNPHIQPSLLIVLWNLWFLSSLFLEAASICLLILTSHPLPVPCSSNALSIYILESGFTFVSYLVIHTAQFLALYSTSACDFTSFPPYPLHQTLSFQMASPGIGDLHSAMSWVLQYMNELDYILMEKLEKFTKSV